VSTDILSSNYFELFDLPVSFDVDISRLQQQYMQLQKQLHPDRFANSSAQEKRLSMQHTSRVNEAQATLKDPVSRATYLLQLKSVDTGAGSDTTSDTAFLMQQLEMREKLETIRQGYRGMDKDPLAELDSFADDIKAMSKEIMQDFTRSYDDEDYDNARECIRKMQFMKKALIEVNELIALIEDELMG
jgi:molecular chaperone HscB